MKRVALISVSILIVFCSAAQERSLKRILPHHAKLQYAGGIGFLSGGIGYGNKKNTFEGDLYYGYVPKKFGGLSMHSLTGKATFYPVREINVQGLQVRPLSAGVLASYTFGKQFFLFAPDNYPYNYYGFPTALHAGFFIGGQVSVKFDPQSKQGIGLYYELGTNDKELKSYLANRSITLKDILNLAIGIKTTF